MAGPLFIFGAVYLLLIFRLIRRSVGVLVAKRPNVGVEVILDGHGLDASEIVQDDDAGHVHLGKEPTVVWMGRRYVVMDLDD